MQCILHPDDLQNNNSTFSGFSEENVMSVDPRGFKSFLQSEADTFLEEEQVRLNSTVSVISYTEGGVRVALTDGQTLTADYVICTFSLGVLQHQDVQFQPPLPLWKREAIHSMNMGVYTKIFLQFPYKFWFDTETGLYADRERGRYPIWESLDHPNYFPGSGILFCTVTGAFSRRISTLPTAILQNELLSVLSSMFPPINTTLPDGTTVPSTIPEPIAMHFHSWNDDPLFRGSYANWPPAFLAEHHANLRADLQGRDEMLKAGVDHLRLDVLGYLQGAYFEGQDIGMNVAECIQAGGCLGLEHVELVKNARPYDIV
ncbi:hypothetical protein PHLCEN_2v5289 [Hermanssonia centrifuga]|uniref:Amine oxidase domain-containing protein n=1 Tax=Hermanssonia centrifuga TaxID=98765 RepID=A0A2R6P8G9_9APHY|nr:hypothetical protein PHLCEN_2v5289 [Hermanssonia centrifuga]